MPVGGGLRGVKSTEGPTAHTPLLLSQETHQVEREFCSVIYHRSTSPPGGMQLLTPYLCKPRIREQTIFAEFGIFALGSRSGLNLQSRQQTLGDQLCARNAPCPKPVSSCVALTCGLRLQCPGECAPPLSNAIQDVTKPFSLLAHLFFEGCGLLSGSQKNSCPPRVPMLPHDRANGTLIQPSSTRSEAASIASRRFRSASDSFEISAANSASGPTV